MKTNYYYKVYQYDTDLSYYQLRHVTDNKKEAIKYANFWGSTTKVDKCCGPEIKTIYEI